MATETVLMGASRIVHLRDTETQKLLCGADNRSNARGFWTQTVYKVSAPATCKRCLAKNDQN